MLHYPKKLLKKLLKNTLTISEKLIILSAKINIPFKQIRRGQ